MKNPYLSFFDYAVSQYGKVTLGYDLNMMARDSMGGYMTVNRRHSYRMDRERLWEAQKGICGWCQRECIRDGNGGKTNEFTVDHLIPLAFGGTNHWRNLIGSCHRCNKNRNKFWDKVKIVILEKPSEPITWAEWLGISEIYEY